MSAIGFGAAGGSAFSAYTPIRSAGIGLPTGRAMASGSQACLITGLYAHVSGRSAARSGYLKLGSAVSDAFTVPAGSHPTDGRGYYATNGWLVQGGTAEFSLNFTGSINFDRGGAGSTTDGVTTWAGTLYGAYQYAQAPIAPTLNNVTQASPVSALLEWTAPSDDGDSAITGYRIEYATNAGFTGKQTLDIGVSTSRVVTGLIPGATYYFRIAALNAVTTSASSSSVVSSVKNVTLIATVGDLDGWETYGTLPAGLTPLVGTGLRRGGVYPVPGQPLGLIKEIQQAGGGSVASEVIGIRRTITGLKIGAAYKLTGSMVSLNDTAPTGNQYAFAVTGKPTGAAATITNTSTVVAIPELLFTATATTHIIAITLKKATTWSSAGWFEAVGFFNIKLWLVPDVSPYKLQDTVYEGSLANHFTYACDTVGAAWWVDRENVTQFRQAASQDVIKATFTDKRTPGAFEYVDIAASYDTRNVVNSLTVNNHGRDPITGDAADFSSSATDPVSAAAWGVRSGTVDMTLRGGYIDLENLVTNPSGEVDAAGWTTRTFTTISRVTTPSWHGAAAICATATSTEGSFWGSIPPDYLPVVAGQKYSWSFYARSNVARPVHAIIQWFNAAGSVISTVNGASATTSTSAWTRYIATATAPAGAVKAGNMVYLDTTASGNLFYVDGAQFIVGDPIAYFDGSTAPTDDYSYEWSGEVQKSTSLRRLWTIFRQRIAELLEANNTPEVTIASIRWNAQENPTLAAQLDIQDRVRVEFRGMSQESRIIGITHELAGDRWMVNLALVKS